MEGEVDLVENEISRMNAELKDAKGIIINLKEVFLPELNCGIH